MDQSQKNIIKAIIKNTAIVNINATQNNTIFLAKNVMGNHIALMSIGLALRKKRGKRSVVNGAEISSEIISTKLIELGYSKLLIKLKGFGRGRESALFGFSSSGLIIEQVIDVTPVPHNGCRPKKSRRI
jgi:small subunit ribosomal protein S11